MTSFPQREAVGILEGGDADDEDNDVDEEAVSSAASIRVSSDRHIKEHALSRTLPIPASPPASGDPLSDVMDWLTFADLGEDDPSHPSRGRTFSSDPVMPVPTLQPRGQKQTAGYCGIGAEEAPVFVDAEEEEWEQRQRQTGAAGRMVVYSLGDRPQDDVHLRGGDGRRLMVASVKRGGLADQAGVKSGDVLVSIDGKKDFTNMSAFAVQRSLRSPVTLVFMGFVGKLQAEVRLNNKELSCGLSSQDQVAVGRPGAPVQVLDEIVFQPTNATLFLAVQPEPVPSGRSWLTKMGLSPGDDGDVGDVGLLDDDLEELGFEFTGPILQAALKESEMQQEKEASTSTTGLQGEKLPSSSPPPAKESRSAKADSQATPEMSAVYELRGQEARNLVSEALRATGTLADSRPFPERPGAGPFPLEAQGGMPNIFSTPMARFNGEEQAPDLLGSKLFPTRIGGVVQDEWGGSGGPWFGGQCQRTEK